MTTPDEKVALDVIFAALFSVTKDMTTHDAAVKKLALLFGLIVHTCRERGLSKDLADELFQYRWDEYREYVHHDA